MDRKLEEMLAKYGFSPVTAVNEGTEEKERYFVREDACLQFSRAKGGFFMGVSASLENALQYKHEDMAFLPGGSEEEILDALQECILTYVVQKEIRTKIELVFLVRGYRVNVIPYGEDLVRALERDGETVIVRYDREVNTFLLRFLKGEDERDVCIGYSSDEDVIDTLTAYLDTL